MKAVSESVPLTSGEWAVAAKTSVTEILYTIFCLQISQKITPLNLKENIVVDSSPGSWVPLRKLSHKM